MYISIWSSIWPPATETQQSTILHIQLLNNTHKGLCDQDVLKQKKKKINNFYFSTRFRPELELMYVFSCTFFFDQDNVDK